MMDDDFPQFDESELSEEDLAVLRAFDEKQSWQTELDESPPATHHNRQDSPDNLLLFFATEAAEDVASMHGVLSQLEASDHIDSSHFVTLRRLAHKIRGTAGAVECHGMATVAHYIEVISEHTAQGQIFPVIGARALALSVASLEAALQGLTTHNSEGDIPSDDLLNGFKDLNVDLEQLLASEESSPQLRETPASYTPTRPAEEGPSLLRVDAWRMERLLRYCEHVAELRVGMENAQEQVDSAVRELRTAQARLRQVMPMLSSLLEGPSTPQATNDLAFSSLVARILHQGGLINTSGEPGRRTDKSRPRGSLIKDPSSLQWDELSLERYDEKDLLVRSFNESMANMLLASSRVDAALTTMNLRQQEYNMQVGNMRSSALMLRLAPLNLLIPYLRQVVEAGGQNVQFEVLGEETEADQEIIDVLALPLGQLLQTCLHGIPTDAEPGRVWFHARGVGNEVTLEIGFSMPVSGGALEAIREPVQRLHGTYTLQRNTAGGLNFCLRFPCSQGASQCLLVRAGSQHLLVPFSQVLRIIEENRCEGLDHCYHLCDLLGFSSSEPPDDTHARPTLILSPETASQEVTGIVVDEAISEVEYIVRPLVPYLQRPGIAGAASDGRGRVLLMLDLAELVRLYATMQRDSGQSTPRYSETRQAKVLVADDSLALRRTLVQTLQQAHFSVEEAHDGMDALEKILASPPDIFLLDVEMPNLNGYDLLSMMSQYPQLSRVKTIMLSSRSSDQHIQHARELGALAYLTKPCSQHELLETIQSLLSL